MSSHQCVTITLPVHHLIAWSQVAANTRGIQLVADLIAEYRLVVVQV